MFAEEINFHKQRADVFYERVKGCVYSNALSLNCMFAPSERPVPFEKRLGLQYSRLEPGGRCGQNYSSAWFHITGTVPQEFEGLELALIFDPGGESMIFGNDGIPVCGLTGGSVFSPNYRKTAFRINGSHKAGDKLEFWIEGAANDLFGLVNPLSFFRETEHPRHAFTGLLSACDLAVFNREAWNLQLDLQVLLSLLKALPEGDWRIRRLLGVLGRAADVWNEDPANSGAARGILKEFLDLRPSGAVMTAHGVGHAHIDTGWLWPVRETIRKCARSFSSQLMLIDEYPEYIFGASAAQHYAFIKENYPGLYEKIRKAVAAGRWEIQGGMWVEADCVLSSGESIVRQFLHGKNFFRDEFGVDVGNLWLPDAFGYSASLPQIIRKAGCGCFLSTKIAWSQFNRFPYQSFLWHGIDGSSVLSHFPPENTYGSMLQPERMIRAQNNCSEGDRVFDFLALFGVGDGGGGPYAELIERGKRMENLEGVPHFKFDRADRFFELLETHRSELPSWNGELYLELHRGTLTAQARTKRGNRKCEQALAETEFLCSMLPYTQYPAAELDRAWKTLLLNQFHDIIPGSSIAEIYRTAEAQHREILDLCATLQERAAAELFPAKDGSALLLNSLPYDVSTLVELPESWNGYGACDESGCELPVQQENGRTVVRVQIPKLAFSVLKRGKRCSVPADADSGELVLENSRIRYVFAPDATLIEAVEKDSGRSVLAPGAYGNEFALYVDRALTYEAWDIDPYYPHQAPLRPQSVRARKVLAGPLRSALEFELKISESTIRQTVVLEAEGTRLDFRTEVDWNESRKMLRVSFPVNVFADRAAFDIPYGYIFRTMHENTSWDMAQFEVSGQRYTDVSDAAHGVALLNDCKYGFKVKNSVIDLALLRSPKNPDPTADLGHHEFVYSLHPHKGDLIHSDVMREAALLNRPPRVFDGVSRGAEPLCTVDSDSVSLEVVKKAEKENAHVLRLVETKGLSAKAKLRFRRSVTLAETDLLEWTEERMFGTGTEFELEFKPFEIKTLKLR